MAECVWSNGSLSDDEPDKHDSSQATTLPPSTRGPGPRDQPRPVVAVAPFQHSDMDQDEDGAPSASTSCPQQQPAGDDKTLEDQAGRDSLVSFDASAESTPRKFPRRSKSAASTPQADLSMVDMKLSWDGSATSGGSTKGETSEGAELGIKIPFQHRAGMLADPIKIAKEREKEERVRQARQRLKEERHKKLEELKEQQRVAQENREKQLEMRRKKIEDLRRRDTERRAAVEERRKRKEDQERARMESILQRAVERVARFEAWKAGGRKGGRGHILGFGSATPRDICQPFERPRRSSSHSALHRQSPNGSEIDSVRPQRRALSACSAVRRHCFVYNHRIGPTTSSPTVASHPHQRPQTVPGLGAVGGRASMSTSMPSPVKMRENKPPHKQRPASIASSMPSFVGGEPAKSPRSKSTERPGRDRSKVKLGPKETQVKDKENVADNDQTDDSDKEKDGVRERRQPKKKERVSLSFFDRLSTPKFNKKDLDHSTKESTPKKEAPAVRVQFADQDGGNEDGPEGIVHHEKSLVREQPSQTTHHKEPPAAKHLTSKDSHRHPTAAASTSRSISPARKETGDKPSGKSSRSKSLDKAGAGSAAPSPGSLSPVHVPPGSPTPPAAAASAAQAGAAEDGTTTSRGGGNAPAPDITAEEYKARLAEKRRQARERAEKEAEEERKKQEEARLAEEEKLRWEEEEDRRLEEEARKARRAEDERLVRAIEAEERRKKEEADKLELERRLKEEADKKAKEEADRLEKEKLEKAKKDEEERIQRKKKLEMIMKRVKTETPADSSSKAESPTKPASISPSLAMLDSSLISPEEQERPVAAISSEEENGTPEVVVDGPAVETTSASMTTSLIQDMEGADLSFLSRSLCSRSVSSSVLESQTAYENKAEAGSDNATTISQTADVKSSSDLSSESKSKFKSPLLQQLVENKAGSSQSSGSKFKSPLLQNLLGKTKVGARIGLSSSSGDISLKDSSNSTNTGEASPSTATSFSAVNGNSSKESFRLSAADEDKDEDTSIAASVESFPRKPDNFEPQVVNNRHLATSLSASSSWEEVEASKLPGSVMRDSALGSSIGPAGESGMSQSGLLLNGHHKSHDLEDSSISLFSPEDVQSESLTGSLPGPPGSPAPSQELEQLIDLIAATSSAKGNPLAGRPILAFEESTRRPDAVTDYLA